MNWLDIVILVIGVVTLIRGYITGLVMQIATLAGVILGAIFAGLLSELIAPYLLRWTDGPAHIIGSVSYVVSFVLIIVLLILLGKLMQSLVKAAAMNTPNRLAGAIFCTVKWFVVLSILINVIAGFDKNKVFLKDEITEQSIAYPIVQAIAPMVIPFLRFEWMDDVKQNIIDRTINSDDGADVEVDPDASLHVANNALHF